MYYNLHKIKIGQFLIITFHFIFLYTFKLYLKLFI